MTARTYTVEGMTCDHCAHAVTTEVSKVPGITGVTVDIAANTVTVTGDTIDDTTINAAVDEAGYTLIG